MSKFTDALRVLTGRATLAAVSVRVDDSAGWESLNQAPGDRPWSDLYADLEDSAEAWRKSFLVRRVVTLMRAYTVGGGIEIGSKNADVQEFITAFWNHKQNNLDRKLGKISDHLCRDGELFPILFTNPQTGISFIRWRTARSIREVLTAANDYETETGYLETDGSLNGKLWHAPAHPNAQDPNTPIMLHFHVNRPLDALRGESDLTPILKWALRYQEWLADRVKLNRQRTRQGLMDLTVADDSQVETVRLRVHNTNPLESGQYVHGPGEELKMHALNIGANDAAEDGRQLRLAVATGAIVGMHYLGEGEGTNYATAKEMGEPTARFYTERQKEIIWNLIDLIETAYTRYAIVNKFTPPEDLELTVNVTEIARADNQTLATAAHSIVQAFAVAITQGWMDDETALALTLKFAGETASEEELAAILARAKAQHAERAAQAAKDQQENAPDEEENDGRR